MNAEIFYKELKKGDNFREVFVKIPGKPTYVIKGCCIMNNTIELYSKSNDYDVKYTPDIGALKIIFNSLSDFKSYDVVICDNNLDILEINKVKMSVGEIVIDIKPKGLVQTFIYGINLITNT